MNHRRPESRIYPEQFLVQFNAPSPRLQPKNPFSFLRLCFALLAITSPFRITVHFVQVLGFRYGVRVSNLEFMVRLMYGICPINFNVFIQPPNATLQIGLIVGTVG